MDGQTVMACSPSSRSERPAEWDVRGGGRSQDNGAKNRSKTEVRRIESSGEAQNGGRREDQEVKILPVIEDWVEMGHGQCCAKRNLRFRPA